MKNRKPLHTQQQSEGFISPHVNQLGSNMRAGVSHCRFVCSPSRVSSRRWAGAGKAASCIHAVTGHQRNSGSAGHATTADTGPGNQRCLITPSATPSSMQQSDVIRSIHLLQLTTPVSSWPPSSLLLSRGGEPKQDQFKWQIPACMTDGYIKHSFCFTFF